MTYRVNWKNSRRVKLLGSLFSFEDWKGNKWRYCGYHRNFRPLDHFPRYTTNAKRSCTQYEIFYSENGHPGHKISPVKVQSQLLRSNYDDNDQEMSDTCSSRKRKANGPPARDINLRFKREMLEWPRFPTVVKEAGSDISPDSETDLDSLSDSEADSDISFDSTRQDDINVDFFSDSSEERDFLRVLEPSCKDDMNGENKKTDAIGIPTDAFGMPILECRFCNATHCLRSKL